MDAIQPDFERTWLRPDDVRVLIALTLFSTSIIVTVWALYSIAIALALLRSDARTIISISAVALVLMLIGWIVRWESSRQAP